MHGAKVRLSVQHATLIQKAFKGSVDIDKVVKEWLDNHLTSEVTTQQGRDWARVHVFVDDSKLNKALRIIYAEAYALGSDMALAAIASQMLDKASKQDLKQASKIDWAKWKPGNKAAANMLSPKGGLSSLMDSRGVTLTGIRGTTVDRIGTELARGLKAGLPPREVAPAVEGILAPLREKIASDLGASLTGLISDSQRALTIAQTEMSRAVSVASMQQYADTGVEMVEWLVADPCDTCAENADVSPIALNDSFPSGDTEPPAHPNCMCSIAPYVVDTLNVSDALS